MSETETLARDVRAFEAFAREQCRRRMELTALACVFISSFAWVIGRVVLAGDPLDAPGRFWLAVLAVVSVVAWLVFRYLPSAYGYRWNYQPSEALLERLTPHQRLLITANKGVPTNSPAGNNFAQLAKAAAGEDPSTAGATGDANPRL